MFFPPISNLAGKRIEITLVNGITARVRVERKTKKKPQKCRDRLYTVVLYDASSYYSFRSGGRHYLTSIAKKRQSSVRIYFHFLLLCLFIFSFTQVGILNGGGGGGSRVLGVTSNGPETAASLLAAGLDARAAELVSYTIQQLSIF